VQPPAGGVHQEVHAEEGDGQATAKNVQAFQTKEAKYIAGLAKHGCRFLG